MSDLDDRIARFEFMAQADPDNEMAHFSLGSAYQQADRHGEAARAFERCVELNPEMSRAYELAGQAMIDAGWSDRAVLMLNKGFEVATIKGDMMPRNSIVELLKSIGKEVPGLSDDVQAEAEEVKASGTFICGRTGKPGNKLEEPPFRGPIGQWIQQNIAHETWQDWIGQGTKVINELRLDFSREEDQAQFDQYMYEFLGIDEALLEQIKSTTPA